MQFAEEPPLTNAAHAALHALRAVPGPSPWYLQYPASNLARPGAELRWRTAGDAAPHTGKTLLVTADDRAVAVADFGCYVQRAAEHHFLVWWSGECDGSGSRVPDVQIHLYADDRLSPVEDLGAAYAGISGERRFYTPGHAVASLVLPASLDEGDHRVEVPAPLQTCGELLLLVHSTAKDRGDPDAMHLCLWCLETSTGRLTIIPQDWFNNGPYDFGYQWVTRVGRDRHSQSIIGEGIRLGIFRLTASGRKIDQWLHQFPFYGPDPSRK